MRYLGDLSGAKSFPVGFEVLELFVPMKVLGQKGKAVTQLFLCLAVVNLLCKLFKLIFKVVPLHKLLLQDSIILDHYGVVPDIKLGLVVSRLLA